MKITNQVLWRGGRMLLLGIFVATAWVPATLSAGEKKPVTLSAEDAPWMLGVNLAVGEFNPKGSELWTDYGYPSVEEIDHFVERGMTVFRVPFLAKRLIQPTLAVEARLREDMEILVALIEHAASREAYVILDMHDYGVIFTAGLIGRNPGSVEEFAAAWRIIAERVHEHPNVIYGLMNEPNSQTAREWLKGANAAIAAIRETGAEQLILVPGSYWSGAHSWTGTDNAVVMRDVVDPLNNFAYEVHQYLDKDSSGTSPDVVVGAGAARLAGFTDWARQNEVRGFLGEFGWADTPEAHVEGEALMRHMSENRDVWIGGTYWAAGPWWGDYMFSVAPHEDEDRPQMDVLKRFIN